MDDFGGKLRQARERRGISLRQIASSTKIAAAALDALEKNDISKLPGGIFSRAFVLSYAVEVGLAAAAAGQLKLELQPISDCWVSLTVDGRKIFTRVMHAGERESQVVEREATVEVGDAGAFAFSVNGRPGKPLGGKGQVKTVKITPATASQFIR